MIYDHNRDHVFEHASVVYDDPEAAKYVWGTAFHWYSGNGFENVRRLGQRYPEKSWSSPKVARKKGRISINGRLESITPSI